MIDDTHMTDDDTDINRELEHDDCRNDPARADEKSSSASPFVCSSSIVGGPDVCTEERPGFLPGFLTFDVSIFGPDGVTVDVFKE